MSSTPQGSESFESTAASLEQLRDRVARAVSEILRLREANRELAERIARLESSDDTRVAFDEDPDALRDKLNGFIQAIDQFLEQQEDAAAS